MQPLDDDALQHLAAYFRALAEPSRLRILNSLREGPCNVSRITQVTGLGQANTSKHLALLHESGLVTREAQGTASFYAIADPATFALCDLVCGNLARIVERQQASAALLRQQLDQAASR